MKKITSLKQYRPTPQRRSANNSHAPKAEDAPKPSAVIPAVVPEYDELLAFVLAWKNGGVFVPVFTSQLDGVKFYLENGVVTFVVYQSGRFQVELTLCAPGHTTPSIRSPDTDTVVAHVAGNIDYFKNGTQVIFGEVDKTWLLQNGISPLNGQAIRVKSTDSFNVLCGTIPGAYMSFKMLYSGVWPVCGTQPPA